MLSAKSDNRKALLLPFSQNGSSINRRKGSGKSKRNLLLWNVQGFRRKAILRMCHESSGTNESGSYERRPFRQSGGGTKLF
jgi:hypothetical protein